MTASNQSISFCTAFIVKTNSNQFSLKKSFRLCIGQLLLAAVLHVNKSIKDNNDVLPVLAWISSRDSRFIGDSNLPIGVNVCLSVYFSLCLP